MVYIGIDELQVMSNQELHSPIERGIGLMVQVDE